MGHPPSGAYGVDVEECKKRISDGSMQSISERRYPSSTVCGEEKHTGMEVDKAMSSGPNLGLVASISAVSYQTNCCHTLALTVLGWHLGTRGTAGVKVW